MQTQAPEKSKSQAPSSTEEPAGQPQIQFGHRNRKPVEEIAARMKSHGIPEPVPAAIATLLLSTWRRVKTTAKCEIRFDHEGRERVYFHKDARHCQPDWAGKEVFFMFMPDFPEAIFLYADGRHLETIPLRDKVEWFSNPEQLARAKADQAEYEGRIRAQYESLKKEDTRTGVAAAKRNADAIDNATRLTRVDTFTPPHPRSSLTAVPGREVPTPSGGECGRLGETGDHGVTEAREAADASPAASPLSPADARTAASPLDTPPAPSRLPEISETPERFDRLHNIERARESMVALKRLRKHQADASADRAARAHEKLRAKYGRAQTQETPA